MHYTKEGGKKEVVTDQSVMFCFFCGLLKKKKFLEFFDLSKDAEWSQTYVFYERKKNWF